MGLTTEGYAPLFKDGEYLGRIKFTIVDGDIMHPEFEPRTKKASPLYRRIETAFAAEMEASHEVTGTPAQRLVHDLELLQDKGANEVLDAAEVTFLYQLIIDILKDNIQVRDFLLFQNPIEVPSGNFMEYHDSGNRTLQMKYHMKGGPVS